MKNLKVLNVNSSGIVSDVILLKPGVTLIDDGHGKPHHKLEHNSKIHVHMPDFKTSGAGEITLKIGDQVIFKHGITTAGYIHSDAFDRSYAPILSLTISVSTNITVSGQIFYSIEPFGKKPVTGLAGNQSVTGE